MLFRFAVRELIYNWKISLFFILNLSIGLIGFVTLDAFNQSLQAYLQQNAKKILAADLSISARRQISDDEKAAARQVMGTPLEESEVYQFFAMLNAGTQARLVSVKAVDQNYPFYGELKLESGTIIKSGSTKKIMSAPVLWAAPELRPQLKIDVGSEVQLGQLKLTVDDFIAKDETQTFRNAAIAPKIYISREFLKESGLIQYGSTFWHIFLYRTQEDSLTPLKKEQLAKVITDPAVDIEDAAVAGEDSGRQLRYLTDYLGLVALIAIFLSSLGAAYVYRLFLSQRLKEIAIYRTLGLQGYQAVTIYVLQAALLGALALIPTLAVSRAFLPLLTFLLNKLVPFSLTPQVTANSVVFSFTFAVLISFLITLPFILKISSLKTARLFNEEKFTESLKIQNPFSFLPAILALWALSMAQAHSFSTGSIFFFSLMGVLVLFFVLGWIVFGLFSKNRIVRWYYRYGLKSMARLRSSSVAAFVALGLGSLLINVLPQIKTSLQAEFYMNPESKTPSLFLFDIQNEQIDPLENLLGQENVNLVLKSPMIRGKILSINGQAYERALETKETFQTREEEREARFRNRGVNLSYREELSESEWVIKGEPITTKFDISENRPAKLSVESAFAERLDLKIGDKIRFDIQGVEAEGEIVNFRKVKWNSFQPNFFILVEPGFLADAPKTFITALPKIPDDKKNELQTKLAQQFPNVSILDVERTVQEVLKIADQMSWSLELMALLALLVGYVVMYSIVRNQVLQRRWEINMLKILGATFKDIRLYLLVESLTVATLAASMGSLVSLLVSFSLTTWVFKTVYTLNFTTPLVSILVIVGTAALVSLLAARSVLKEKPLVILREI